ncbi:MAG: hypothetical protein WD768_16025 [Phycisphaeraceae bacterium]
MVKIFNSPLFVSVRVMLQLIGFVRLAMWIVKGVVWVIVLARGHRYGSRDVNAWIGLDAVFNTEAYHWIQLLRSAMTITAAIDWLLRKERLALAAANRGVFAQPWTIDARLGPVSAFGAGLAATLNAPVWTLHDETDIARPSPCGTTTGQTPARVIARVPSAMRSL